MAANAAAVVDDRELDPSILTRSKDVQDTLKRLEGSPRLSLHDVKFRKMQNVAEIVRHVSTRNPKKTCREARPTTRSKMAANDRQKRPISRLSVLSVSSAAAVDESSHLKMVGANSCLRVFRSLSGCDVVRLTLVGCSCRWLCDVRSAEAASFIVLQLCLYIAMRCFVIELACCHGMMTSKRPP